MITPQNLVLIQHVNYTIDGYLDIYLEKRRVSKDPAIVNPQNLANTTTACNIPLSLSLPSRLLHYIGT